MRTRLPFLFLLICTCLAPAAAQNPVPTPTPRRPDDGSLRPREPMVGWDQPAKPAVDPNLPTREPRVISDGVLAPADVDRLTYGRFLSLLDPGIIRLLPRQFGESKFAHPTPAKMFGGGAYYSFFYL